MSLKIIELNDSGIKVGDEGGIIVQSPGFALVTDNELVLGDSAEQQARLQPTNSYNKYWHELSMEALSHSDSVRHHADIAYAQLLHLAEIGDIDADVILAVPGNFTRQQLAILLGLAKQSPFNPVGVVDSALAAAITTAAPAESVIYADIQLHQVLLTKLAVIGGQLKTESVIQVPGVGSQNFMDMMMQLATDMFIQQSRFNPQHNAQSEQQLYNNLPEWLRQTDKDSSSLLLELKTASAVHTAKMPRESLIRNLHGYYQRINQQLDSMQTDNRQTLLLSAGMAALPGFTSTLGAFDMRVLDPETVNASCLEYREQISTGTDNIRLINSLPVADASGPDSLAEVTDGELPTHALFSNRAITVDRIEIRNNAQLNGHGAMANTIAMSIADLPQQLGRIQRRGDQVFVDTGDQEFFLNQKKVIGEQKLTLGDRIRFGENSDEICLIQVNDG